MKRFASIFVLAMAAGLAACTQIDTGNVGVETTLGQVNATEMQPGTHLTPFKSITEVLGSEAPIELNDMRPQTSDKITMEDVDIDIYIQTNVSKAAEIMTRFKGDRSDVKGESGTRVGFNYVTRKARETVYDVISKHGSATVHTERNTITAEVVKDLQAALDKDAGKGWFTIVSANVRSLLTDRALEANIKAAANRQFEINSKTKEVELARLEADRKRAEAQGDADSIRIKAEAVSKQGGAEYVQLKALEKWNGVLPTNTGSSIPFVSIK